MPNCLIYHAYGEDGPYFDPRCPNCYRFIRFPETIEHNDMGNIRWPKGQPTCSRCGPVKAGLVGWGRDWEL